MEHDVPAVEIVKMTKVQKLAALLIILGPDSASSDLSRILTSTNWRPSPRR